METKSRINRFGKFLSLGVLFVFLASSVAACGTAALGKESLPTITSKALMKEYRDDQAAADAKYKGKTMLVTGRVDVIGKVFGTPYLLLRDNGNESGFQCYFDHQKEDPTKVKVGDQVTLRARIRGGNTDIGDDCSLALS